MRCLAWLLLGSAVACGSGGRSGPPDIVLVSIDSLRPDHLGLYGYGRATSPHLDALAAEGVRFTDAVSTTSWTLPAHAALFTGLFDHAHGVLRDGQKLRASHRTLAEHLRDAGYHTAGFFGGPYLHPTFGLDQGFEVYQSCMAAPLGALPGADLRREAAGGVRPGADVTGPRTLGRVEDWLSTLDERPFFLFLHMWDVHFDYRPPPEYEALFDPDYDGNLDTRRFFRNPAIHAGMSPRDLEHVIALYDGEIRFTDDVLGEIFERLDRAGRFAQALVVVTADHGDEFFEHGGKGHRRTLFEEVVRIPLVLRWPGHVAAGIRVDRQVSLVDVMPTLLSLAGVPVPGEIQGRDLAPLLRGEELAPEPALLELEGAPRPMRAIRFAHRKLTHLGKGRFRFAAVSSADLSETPLELPAEGFRPALGELERLLRESEALARPPGPAPASGALEPEIEQRLRSLGYLDEPAVAPPGPPAPTATRR